MKQFAILCLCAALALTSSLCAVAEEAAQQQEEAILSRVLGSEDSFNKKSVKGKYKTYDALGVDNEIVSVWSNDDGYVFRARVHYGADYYENPQLDVYVGIAKDGTIKGIEVGEAVEHTPQFLDLVTPEYLEQAYVGNMASANILTDAVSGATFSSDAVLYAVRLCSNYSANVFKAGEKNDVPVEIKRMMNIVPGEYTPVEVDASFSSKSGEVQYAATGTTVDGVPFYALIVKSAFVPQNPENNMAAPTYQLWIDTTTNKVFAASMLSGRFYEGFEMPEDKLMLYYDVEIAAANAFDAFMDGLVTDAPVDVLTSATGSFADTTTGATPEGNDTSRAIRDCFIVAAQYYCAQAN